MSEEEEERIGSKTSDVLREAVPNVVGREPHLTVLPDGGEDEGGESE